MNKIKSKIIGSSLLAAVVLICMTVRAAPTLVVGSLITVPVGNSNSVPFVMLSQPANSQLIAVTHGALTSTNEFYVSSRFTFDSVNFISNSVIWWPQFTNPTTEYIQATYWQATPLMQLIANTTNTIQWSVTYGQ